MNEEWYEAWQELNEALINLGEVLLEAIEPIVGFLGRVLGWVLDRLGKLRPRE